jgi:exonuclease III
VCLQETHSISEEESSSWLDHATSSGSNKFGYKCISSPGTIRSCGVAILYNPSYNVVSCSRDQDGRLLCVEFSKDGNLIQLVNIYAPNSAKSASAFFESLYQVLDPDTPTVLCGDFNTVVDPIKDRLGCNSQSRSAYNRSATLHHLMSTYDLHDAWRKIHPNAQEYYWHRPNGSQASRIDMLLVFRIVLVICHACRYPSLFPLRPFHCIFGALSSVHHPSWTWRFEVGYSAHFRCVLC